jgi:uncharacterized paraquat-inducible protein A
MSGMDIYHVITRDKMRVQPIVVSEARRQRQERLQGQMLLLSISSVVIFVATSLPISIRRVYGAYEIAAHHVTNLYDIVSHNGILTVVASVNYAVSTFASCS